MKKDWVDNEELWNKSLLGFVLAVHNNQFKTAQSFVKNYEKTRAIVSRLIAVYE